MLPCFRLFASLFALLLSACTTNSAGRLQLQLASDSRLEKSSTRTIERLKNQRRLLAEGPEHVRLRCVVNRLAARRPQLKGLWEIALLKDDQPNAFALAGRRLIINYGLLRVALNEDQIAAVLAHEIAHVLANHAAESTSQHLVIEGLGLTAGWLSGSSADPLSTEKSSGIELLHLGVLYPLSQVQEKEADLLGLELMVEGGFDPHEALHFWHNMLEFQNLTASSNLSTHPTHLARIEAIGALIAKRGWAPLPEQRKQNLCESAN